MKHHHRNAKPKPAKQKIKASPVSHEWATEPSSLKTLAGIVETFDRILQKDKEVLADLEGATARLSQFGEIMGRAGELVGESNRKGGRYVT